MKEITLTRGKVAQVDDDNFAWLNQWKWHTAGSSSHRCYAKTNIKLGKSQILMHRLILNAPQGIQVDHINGDGLDNRRENLRLCNPYENMHNVRRVWGKSKYKGVSFQVDMRYGGGGRGGWWISHIYINGKKKRLGHFKTELDAAKAYDAAAIEHYGAFACTNQTLNLYGGVRTPEREDNEAENL